MKFETVRIHFLGNVWICRHPEILLPWQRDVTNSPLYYRIVIGLTACNQVVKKTIAKCVCQNKIRTSIPTMLEEFLLKRPANEPYHYQRCLINTYVGLARQQNMKCQSERQQEKKKHGKNL